MNSLIQLSKTTPVFLVALACFGLSPTAQAMLPAPTPDGFYPGQNTAEGQDALINDLVAKGPPQHGDWVRSTHYEYNRFLQHGYR
jgi:hypothetical protein